MIIKFYKGPWHGKKREVPPDSDVVRVSPAPLAVATYESIEAHGSPDSPAILMGLYNRTNHTHPDGSVFFVWDGWNR